MRGWGVGGPVEGVDGGRGGGEHPEVAARPGSPVGVQPCSRRLEVRGSLCTDAPPHCHGVVSHAAGVTHAPPCPPP